MGIHGNEMTDQVVSQGSSHSLIGPDPALGVAGKVVREVIWGWASRKREEYLQSIHGQKQAQAYLKRLKRHFYKCGSEVKFNVILAYCYW
jgi:hypothetical protein